MKGQVIEGLRFETARVVATVQEPRNTARARFWAKEKWRLVVSAPLFDSVADYSAFSFFAVTVTTKVDSSF